MPNIDNYGQGYSRNYPTDIEFRNDEITNFPEGVDAAMVELRDSHAWTGTVAEKTAKYDRLLTKLSQAYQITKPRLVIGFTEENNTPRSSGASNYNPMTHTLTLLGKFSVVTFLHEFAHAMGYDEYYACVFSDNLFKKYFPQSYARARQFTADQGGAGHLLLARPRPQPAQPTIGTSGSNVVAPPRPTPTNLPQGIGGVQPRTRRKSKSKGWHKESKRHRKAYYKRKRKTVRR